MRPLSQQKSRGHFRHSLLAYLGVHRDLDCLPTWPVATIRFTNSSEVYCSRTTWAMSDDPSCLQLPRHILCLQLRSLLELGCHWLQSLLQKLQLYVLQLYSATACCCGFATACCGYFVVFDCPFFHQLSKNLKCTLLWSITARSSSRLRAIPNGTHHLPEKPKQSVQELKF